MKAYEFYDLEHGGRCQMIYRVNRGEIDESVWDDILAQFGVNVSISKSGVFAKINLGQFNKHDLDRVILMLDRWTGKVIDEYVSDQDELVDCSDSYINDYENY